MWLFWICAGALAAGAALLVATRAASAAAAAATAVDAEEPALAVHRRALLELDDLAARGLLGPDEAAAAQAEAGRRLLAAADRRTAPERPGGRRSRQLVTAGAAAAALLALALYLGLGRPGLPDQPYRARLRVWSGRDRLDTLDPARLAAVLGAVAVRRPDDPQVFEYLGRARLAAGEAGEAATAFAHAARLAPANADYPAEAGEALLEGAGGKVPPEAQAAFREALRRDPKNPAARYHLARARIADGDLEGGLADWRALAADLPPADPRRPGLLAELDAAAARPARATGEAAAAGAAASDAAALAPGPVPAGPSADQVAAAAQAAPAAGPGRAEFIRAMVAARAARLRANPDDPDGWALLVRSYGVLGDAAGQAQALAQARTALAHRPADLRRVESQAGATARPLGPPGPAR